MASSVQWYDSVSNTTTTEPANLGGFDYFSLGQELLGVLNIDLFSGVGNLLSNGFDLSCWNSSYSPSKAKEETPAVIKAKLDKSGFLGQATPENLNQFLNFIYQEVYGIELDLIGRFVKCTNEGYLLKVKLLKAGADEVLSKLRAQGFIVQSIGQKKVKYEAGAFYATFPSLLEKTYEAYTFYKEGKSAVDTPPKEDVLPNNSDSDSDIPDPPPPPTPDKKDSSFPWWILGLFFI